MCGIAGFVAPRGEAGRDVLERMTRSLAHRGPDAEGYFLDPERGVHLGHRRLSIVDLSGGAQPMATTDQALVIVFNGEIYNHSELKAELQSKGCRFQTDHSDTEVLLEGYREWGEGILERLNGMFAFAIYDKVHGKLFIARDRFGKKPLYWFQLDGVFAFASELTALMRHPVSPRSESPIALKKYFAYGYIPAPHSVIDGIQKLPSGWFGTLDLANSRWSMRKWWEFRLEPESSATQVTPDQCNRWAGELLEVLDRAVKRRLMSDVPLGVFLSGGIDSSAVAALAARHLPAGRLRTFSVGFTDPSFDELPYAREAAAFIGSVHQTEVLDLSRARELIPGLLARLDEPMGDGSLLPTWLLCGFTRRHVTVALGGDGGDELFAGYDPFKALRTADVYASMVPRAIHPALLLLASRLPVSHANISLDFKIKRMLRGLSYGEKIRLPIWMGPLEPKQIDDYFGVHTAPEELYSEAIEAWDSAGEHASPVDRALQFFTRLYLQDDILAKVDRASMIHGLEVRSPFLDLEVINFARKLPHTVKLRGGTTKWILKKALEPILPASILYRKKKGFGTPLGQWFRDRALAPEIPVGGSGGFVERAVHSHQTGRGDERLFLWCQHVLGEWRKSNTGR
ncbi:MAG: asparagine synthase (glutamine-hydrolyzing) [Verrucomicrobia bacterium]|nr:MAG: asparagine synthase (glutamine-hydrolyzing) [Verrucomicrobiota bacterium]